MLRPSRKRDRRREIPPDANLDDLPGVPNEGEGRMNAIAVASLPVLVSGRPARPLPVSPSVTGPARITG